MIFMLVGMLAKIQEEKDVESSFVIDKFDNSYERIAKRIYYDNLATNEYSLRKSKYLFIHISV